MRIATYQVEGMTCEHCVQAVTTELSSLDGVEAVDVDLSSGSVAVTSEAELDPDEVRAAVEDAGYEVSS